MEAVTSTVIVRDEDERPPFFTKALNVLVSTDVNGSVGPMITSTEFGAFETKVEYEVSNVLVVYMFSRMPKNSEHLSGSSIKGSYATPAGAPGSAKVVMAT